MVVDAFWEWVIIDDRSKDIKVAELTFQELDSRTIRGKIMRIGITI